LAGLELAVVIAMSKRRNRFPAAAWFAITTLIPMEAFWASDGHSVLAAVHLAARIGVIAALLWPRQKVGATRHLLPALPLSWAWCAILSVWLGLCAVIAFAPEQNGSHVERALACVVIMFLGLTVSSWL